MFGALKRLHALKIRHAESAADDGDEAAIDHAASEAIRRTSDEQSGISDRATGSI
jgi:hypothetical protein